MAEAKTEIKPVEPAKPKFTVAVDWAVEFSISKFDGACGICTWRPWDGSSGDEIKRLLASHIRRKHRDSIIELYDAQTLDLSTLRVPAPPADSDNELLAVAGISETRDLDRFDRLAVPPKIRHQAELEGAEFRWVRPERVDHFKWQGAEVVHLNGERGVMQPSTEDGILRANEMVCMKMPFELLQIRERRKQQASDSGLNARAEEIQAKRDEYEKKAYEILRKDGKDHQTALQVARALTQRRRRESNLGMTIRDRHGERSY